MGLGTDVDLQTLHPELLFFPKPNVTKCGEMCASRRRFCLIDPFSTFAPCGVTACCKCFKCGMVAIHRWVKTTEIVDFQQKVASDASSATS